MPLHAVTCHYMTLQAVFVPVNRKFSVLQSVLQSCNMRLSSYFKVPACHVL